MPYIFGGLWTWTWGIIAVFVALYLLSNEVISELIGGLCNNLTGETARRNEARRQFNEELLAGRHPSEDVLALVSGTSFHPPLPEAVRKRVQWHASTYHEAVACVRAEMQVSEERASSIGDHKAVAEAFAQLVKNCDTPWKELIRLRKAMRGSFDIEPWPFPERVFCSVGEILRIVAEAHGSVPPRLASLLQAVVAQLRPTAYVDLKSWTEALRSEHEPLSLPVELHLLRFYDAMDGNNLARKSALSYWALIVAAGRCCEDSRPTTIIKAQYLELLRPFLTDGSGTSSDEFSGDGNKDRNSAGSHSSSSSSGGANGNQSALFKSYEILGVASEATDEEVKSAYRDLAKIWHPDRFSEKDARLREKAAGKFREAQEAYEFITKSRVGTSPPPPKRPTASTDSHSPDEEIDYVKRKINECRQDIEAFLVSLKAGHASSGDWKDMLQRQDEAARQSREVLARIRRSAPNAALSSIGQKIVILETRTARLRDLYEWASEDEMMALTVLPDGSLVP